MSDEKNQPPGEPKLAAFESKLFRSLFGFHQKTMDLLRNSSLADEQRDQVVERIKTLLEEANEEMERTNDPSVLCRLDDAYEEVKRLVDELAASQAGGKEG